MFELGVGMQVVYNAIQGYLHAMTHTRRLKHFPSSISSTN